MPDKKVLHTLIDQTAVFTPQKIAISTPEQFITYGDLKEHTDNISHHLSATSIRKSAAVGIYMKKSAAYVISLLAVNKAGGMFMPLDPDYPVLRTEKLLRKAAVSWFIANADQAQALQNLLISAGLTANGVNIIVLDKTFRPVQQLFIRDNRTEEKIISASTPSGHTQPDGNDSNYLLYTSGSTGEPKIIEGCHKSLSHFIHWEVETFKLDGSVNVSHLAATTFDVSLRDIFVPLLAGGRLSIPPENTTGKLLEWIVQEKITLVHTVPTVFRSFIQELKSGSVTRAAISHLKHILIAGEALYTRDVQEWRSLAGEEINIVNLYGPSETTLAKIFNPVQELPEDPHSIIPLGSPLPGTKVLILSNDLLCGPGAVGEICIKTPFRSKGYYNDPALTAAAFIQNPLHNNFEDIIYRTGDLGRYLKDGTIGFVGRSDKQIKIRGYRVEMNEVEAVLKKMPSVIQVLVKAYQQKNMEYVLIAYYTEHAPVLLADMITQLQEQLPAAFIPSYFVRVDTFPLNLNGKIDQKALPLPEDLLYQDDDFTAPVSSMEKQVAAIWSTVLGHDRISTTRSFFMLGGHSLSATKIISQIYRDMGKEISVKEFFEHPTIKEQVRLLEIKFNQQYHAISQVPSAPYYALSYGQRNIWVSHQKEGAQSLYNMPASCIISGEIDFTALNRAFISIIKRHESLRTGFILVNGIPMQKVSEQFSFTLEENVQHTINRSQIEQYLENELNTPFNLETPPLIRGRVLKLDSDGYLLLLTIHHIVCDGWSIGILIDEILSFYTAYSAGEQPVLPALPVQYKDYAAWFNSLAEDKINKHHTYWQQQLGGDLTPLKLPVNRSFDQRITYEGKVLSLTLTTELSARLRSLANETAASLFIVILSAVNLLLYKYSGQSSVSIGAPVTGRSHQDLERLIGLFLNYLVLKNTMRRDQTCAEFLAQVKNNTLEAYNHQRYPYGLLVEEFYPDGTTGNRNPFYDVLLVMNNRELNGTDERLSDLERILGAEKVSLNSHTSKVALTFFVTDAEQIHINMEYSTELFNENVVRNMLSVLEKVLTFLPQHGDTTLKDFMLMIGDEQEKRSVAELSNLNLNFITEDF